MYLENLVFDALEPQRLGRFYEELVAGERLTDAPDIFETRLSVAGGPELDLCFQAVSDPPTEPHRLQLAFTHAGTTVDPDGNPLLVLDDPSAYADTGPLVAVWLDSADPDRDVGFWAWLTGWTRTAPWSLRDPSQCGPVIELRPEASPKGTTKNRRHLDLRLEVDDDAENIVAGIVERGGRELRTDWGDLPWTSYLDPSGNEFCLLPVRP